MQCCEHRILSVCVWACCWQLFFPLTFVTLNTASSETRSNWKAFPICIHKHTNKSHNLVLCYHIMLFPIRISSFDTLPHRVWHILFYNLFFYYVYELGPMFIEHLVEFVVMFTLTLQFHLNYQYWAFPPSPTMGWWFWERFRLINSRRIDAIGIERKFIETCMRRGLMGWVQLTSIKV